MHRTKKLIVTATAAALLMAGGVSSAMADHKPGHAGKVTICHRTGSDSNPYVMITISENARHAHIGEDAHPPKGNPPRFDFEPEAGKDCSGNTIPPNPPNPPGNGDCVAHSDSSNSYSQHGFLNVGNVGLNLANLLAQPLCQVNILTNPAIALLGDAYSGGGHSGSAADCNSTSSSSDTFVQDGFINVGNIDVDTGNALAQPLCQASVLTDPAVALFGEAFSGSSLGGGLLGGSSLGSGILSGSPLGVLGYVPGFVLNGFSNDIQVVASVLLHF